MTELPISLIVLEYIKAVLNWPVVVGVISIYILVSYREVLVSLIGRITGVDSPWLKLDIPYPDKQSRNAAPVEIQKVVTEKTGDKSDLSTEVQKLNTDLNTLLRKNIASNFVIIGTFVDALWKKSPHNLFKTPKPQSLIELAKMIGTDPAALKDLQVAQNSIEEFGAGKTVDREKMTRVLITTEQLIHYFGAALNKK